MEETKTTDIIQETNGGMEEPQNLPSTDLSLGQCAKYGLAAAATIAVSVVLYKKLFRPLARKIKEKVARKKAVNAEVKETELN